MSRQTDRPRVLILGGGFAGLACANALSADQFAVSLVDAKADFEFLPNIHELLSGVKKPRQLRLPLAAALRARGHRFVRGRIDRIDPSERRANIGAKTLRGDYLVVALGSADATFGVSGVAEHSFGFKSVEQCAAIRARLQSLAKARRAANIVIVGGGLEGVEALGEILRAYRESAMHITLVEARERLLPEASTGVSKHIAALARHHSVELLLSDPVKRITAKTVALQSARRLRSDLTIWTGGPRPPDLLAESGLGASNSWSPVDRCLQHTEFKNVFIAGDSAKTPFDLSKQAYHAMDMGRAVARNIQYSGKGQGPRAYRPSPKPTLLAFGDVDTVLTTPQGSLAGPALAAGKEAVFAGVMAQLDQRPMARRLEAAVDRGKTANKELLWPRLKSWNALKKQARLKPIK
ncbi:MAG: NAD(P)/FAD-dependent oxidoreductase [Congregibacter sp.]